MGKRVPVILLHGIRLSGSMWEPTAERLQERKFITAAQDGRLSVWPGLNHLSIMADPVPLARTIDDACLVVDAREE